MNRDWELRVRTRVFDYLRDLRERHGGAVPSGELERRLEIDGEALALMSRQRGIHTPRQLDAALTLKTSSTNPYDDWVDPGYDGLVRYHYRDPATSSQLAIRMAEADNLAVRKALRARLPVAYLWGIDRGWYLPFAPAEVVADDEAARQFHLDVTELAGIDLTPLPDIGSEAVARRYQAREVRARVHQARFRQMVLRAYRRACAICALRHAELLDAAHILEDAEGGDPAVTNGLALCKLHHAAFDRNVLGIRPDFVIEVNRRVLDEEDGPMLLHGLQGFHEQRLRVLPARTTDRPAAELLEARWDRFLKAG